MYRRYAEYYEDGATAASASAGCIENHRDEIYPRDAAPLRQTAEDEGATDARSRPMCRKGRGDRQDQDKSDDLHRRMMSLLTSMARHSTMSSTALRAAASITTAPLSIPYKARKHGLLPQARRFHHDLFSGTMISGSITARDVTVRVFVMRNKDADSSMQWSRRHRHEISPRRDHVRQEWRRTSSISWGCIYARRSAASKKRPVAEWQSNGIQPLRRRHHFPWHTPLHRQEAALKGSSAPQHR